MIKTPYRIYGKLMYWRWLLSGYDHVGALISFMPEGWRKMKILDVGSGPGNIAADKRLEGVDITCVDADREAVDKCSDKGLKAVFLDVTKIPKKYSSGEFDIIWCLDVLEHLEKGKALELLKYLEKIASRRLIVFIPLGEFPQDKDPSGIADPELVKHRSSWGLSDFSRLGFKCKVLRGFHWDIRLYCSSLEKLSYPVVRDAMWAVKEK